MSRTGENFFRRVLRRRTGLQPSRYRLMFRARGAAQREVEAL